MSRGNLGHGGPYGRLRALDGDVVIGASIPSLWRRLAQAIGRPDLLTQAPAADADGVWWRFGEVLRPAIAGWLAERSTRDALNVLHENGVPAASIATVTDVLSSAHARNRRVFVRSHDEIAGDFTAVGVPLQISSIPRRPSGEIPTLGRHSREILRDFLGYSDERIDTLVRAKVIAEPQPP